MKLETFDGKQFLVWEPGDENTPVYIQSRAEQVGAMEFAIRPITLGIRVEGEHAISVDPIGVTSVDVTIRAF